MIVQLEHVETQTALLTRQQKGAMMSHELESTQNPNPNSNLCFVRCQTALAKWKTIIVIIVVEDVILGGVGFGIIQFLN